MADLEVASAKGVYRKMDMIKAVNLKKYYTSDTYEVRALDGVLLTVEDGELQQLSVHPDAERQHL